MAFTQGSATSQENFIQNLFTFLTANGWTQLELDTTNDRASIRLTGSSVYVHFNWDNSNSINIAQSLGFSGPSVAIDAHTNDSGNGNESETERRITGIGNGPFAGWFGHTDGSTYAHIVLEYADGIYRHINFGEIVKVGTWTGGEYCACTYLEPGDEGNPMDISHSILFDGLANVAGVCGTLHAESLPNFGASTKWGVIWGGFASRGLDGDGNDRFDVHGQLRGGWLPNAVGFISANPSNGFIPMYPIHLYYRRQITPQEWRLLGFIKDVRGINMRYIQPEEEFVVGGDTWKVYPWYRKSVDSGEQSKYLGIAVKKIP